MSVTTDGVLGRAHLEDDALVVGALVFMHARRPTARVEGPRGRLALLREVLGDRRLMPDDLLSARMPASIDALTAEVVRRQGEIDELLAVGRHMVEAVERLVCALYGVPEELTELVVESAVTRAGTVAANE